jgi:putative phosphoribosyl transferase
MLIPVIVKNERQRQARAEQVEIASDSAVLEGILTIPVGAREIVLFARGSGSSRLSPRNSYVAGALQRGAIGTLLFDPLTEDEASDRKNVFDVDLLAHRVIDATKWLRRREGADRYVIGYFGASTGAAAALIAAAEDPSISAVVSGGGRPDLAMRWLDQVKAPTALIVGGEDTGVIGMNQAALRRLKCEKALEIVPGATHLFEEPGTLEKVLRLATDWFQLHTDVPAEDPIFGEDPIFSDRAEGGRKLAVRLRKYKGERPVVLAIPRGGVPVALERGNIARYLKS